MIERVTLLDFQQFKKKVVEFSPGVTTLVGRSRAGKTTIVRALIWATMNRPRGDHIVRHGAKAAKAVLRIDGKKVIRAKSRGRDNSYAVGDKIFRAFSKGVPDEIVKLVNLSEINFQKQLDPPFWFTQSASQISKSLNSVVNLAAIDDALAAAASEVRQAKARHDVCLERLAAAKEKVKELAWVPRFTAHLDRLEAVEQSYTQTSNSLARLRQAVGAVVRYSRTAVRASGATLGAANVARLGAVAVETAARRAELGKLLTNVIESAERVNLNVPDISALAAMRKEGDELAERRRTLETLVEESTSVEKELWQLESDLRKEEAKTSAIPNRCPTCGQIMNRSRLQSSAPTCTSRTHRR